MFKFCPECQSKKIFFNNKTRYTCSQCGLEFYHNVAAGVVGIFTYNGKILFQIRAQEPSLGKLDSPGGFLDPGETAEEALTRECLEEINVEMKDFIFLGTATNEYFFKGFNYHVCDMIFHGELPFIPETYDKNEVRSIVMLDVREIEKEKIAFPSIIEGIQMYKRYFDL